MAGGDINSKITKRVELIELFLIFVSPEFLDSDYCVEQEMMRVLERVHVVDVNVIPILSNPVTGHPLPYPTSRHCLRRRTNQHCTNQIDTCLDVVQLLLRVLEAKNVPQGRTNSEGKPSQSKVAKNRVKYKCDETGRSDF